MAKKEKKQKIEVMTTEMVEKEMAQKERFIDPRRFIQLVFDFYTMPLE